jgi:hypothetical protein
MVEGLFFFVASVYTPCTLGGFIIEITNAFLIPAELHPPQPLDETLVRADQVRRRQHVGDQPGPL